MPPVLLDVGRLPPQILARNALGPFLLGQGTVGVAHLSMHATAYLTVIWHGWEQTKPESKWVSDRSEGRAEDVRKKPGDSKTSTDCTTNPGTLVVLFSTYLLHGFAHASAHFIFDNSQLILLEEQECRFRLFNLRRHDWMMMTTMTTMVCVCVCGLFDDNAVVTTNSIPQNRLETAGCQQAAMLSLDLLAVL